MTANQNNDHTGITGQHWVRYGTAADQRYLEGDFRETYDQIVVNGNMVAHMPSALSVFLTQRARKPFVIDPQTHAFAHDITHLQSTSKSSAGQIKKSWKKLIERYGDFIAQILLKDQRPLDPDDFNDTKVLADFSDKVLLFQKDTITREIKEGEDREYLEFLQRETGENALVRPPALLIAPYFFMDGPLSEQWLERNLQFVDMSRSVLRSKEWKLPLAAQVVISKEVLSNEDLRKQIIRQYVAQTPDVVLLWIDQFSEHDASESELSHFIKLLFGFAEAGIPVVNLYGGFFSVALMRFSAILKGKIAAVCHGLEYGETRPVVPLGGGTPVAKFYSRQLHHRLPPRVALRAIQELGGTDSVTAFHNNICNCKNCMDLIQSVPKSDIAAYFETKESTFWRAGKRISMDFPTGVASDNCTKHYMWCKAWEYRDLNLSLDELKEELEDADRKLRKPLGAEHAGHPLAWSKIFR